MQKGIVSKERLWEAVRQSLGRVGGVLFLGALAVVCVTGAATAEQRMALGGGPSGGIFGIFGGALARILEDAVPGSTVSVVATQGSAENAIRVGRGDLEFALAGNDAAHGAYTGAPGFPAKMGELRVVMAGHKAYEHLMVAKNSPIRRWSDLRGKRIAVTSPVSPNYTGAAVVLEQYGIAQSDYVPQWITSSGFADGIRNGTLDAASMLAGYPAPAPTELCASRVGLRLLPVAREIAEAIAAKYPYFAPAVIPSEAYSCLDENVPTIASTTLLITHARVPEVVVYRFVKAIIEGGRLAEVHAAGREWTLENALSGLAGIPLHPGAERYFRERGVLP